jgi:hypothetical protein
LKQPYAERTRPIVVDDLASDEIFETDEKLDEFLVACLRRAAGWRLKIGTHVSGQLDHLSAVLGKDGTGAGNRT